MRAALELFTTRGYHGSTTLQIAARAGVAEGSIYRHFESKAQLLNEVYRAALAAFAAVVRQMPASLACAARLEGIAQGWRDIALRHPALVRLVFVSRLRNLLDAASREAAKALREEIEKVIASGKAAGLVRPGSVEVLADIWWQVIGLMLERVASGEWRPEQSAARLAIESAWAAIGLPAPPSEPAPPAPPAAPLRDPPPPG